jgi:mRNA-degrading endonuclease RelE of RelBE toxin-antitoxin system
MRVGITEAMDVIAQNHPHLDGHIKKLKGDLNHMHRFRMGDLRILYEIDDSQEMVWIKTIEWRGSAYK